ncbi:MAG: hypothetical protein FJ144_16845 [Deltaproteobacteria bacterium]|nr:hypothetical protein [Deltaproteobacteria bacterium]
MTTGNRSNDGVMALVVWGIWTAALAAAFYYVARYANDLPYRDEWQMVTVATDGCPGEPSWFFKHNNEHRIPLPKLVYCGLMAVSGGDFRAGTLLSVAMFGAVAAGLMIVVSRFRGRVALQDAFFPLLLLHWGHAENFVLSFQIAFTIPIALAAAAAGVILSDRARESSLASSFVVACAVLMPWCSVVGLALAPALVPWLIWSGTAAWRARTTRGRRLAVLLWSGAAICEASIVFLLMNFPRSRLPSPGLASDARLLAHLVLQALGPTALQFPVAYGAIVLGVAAAIFRAVVRSLIAAPREGRRAIGLLLFVGAVLALLAGLAHGRSLMALTASPANRYVSIGILLYLGLFLLAALAPGAWATRLQVALAMLVVSSTPGSYALGRDFGATLSARLEPVFADVRAGVSPAMLAERHVERVLCSGGPRRLARQMSRLCDAHAGPYWFLRAASSTPHAEAALCRYTAPPMRTPKWHGRANRRQAASGTTSDDEHLLAEEPLSGR